MALPHRTKEVTWSSKVAYAVGLIATDGCLSSNGRHIDLTSKDKEQLENFLICIEKQVRITEKPAGGGRYCTRVQFSDVRLHDFLRSVGITPRKSHTIGALAVPDAHFFDFLRGHYDGDGCFYSYFDPRWRSSFMFYLTFLSASRVHIDWLRTTIARLVGVHGHIVTSKSNCVIQLRYAKREAYEIIQKMYPSRSAICLSRKRLKIDKAMRIVGLPCPGGGTGRRATLRW
jgi:hypothetical protein